MGDNRENSADSRFRNPPWIKRSDFIGKAFVKIWPPGRIGLVHVPSYPGGNATATGVAQAAPATPFAAFVLAAGVIVRRRAR
jgi:signal peptidase I